MGTLDVGNDVNGGSLEITNGLVLDGTVFVGNPTNQWYGGIGFAGTQTFSGNGRVVFGNAGYNNNALYLSIPGTTLTIMTGTLKAQNGLSARHK